MKQTILIFLTIVVLLTVFMVIRRAKKINNGLPKTETTQKQIINSTETVMETVNSTDGNEVVDQGLALDIELPVNNSIVNTSSVLVRGKTNAKADIFVNEQELKADVSGNFSATVNLEEGANYILISANDEAGNFAEREIVVNLETIQ